MTTPDNNDQTGSNPKRSGHDDTVILMRCPKHGIAFMPNEGCPECEKEKDPPAGEGAGKSQ